MIKEHLSPRIDQVYHYYGDIDSDGKDENALTPSETMCIIHFRILSIGTCRICRLVSCPVYLKYGKRLPISLIFNPMRIILM